MQIPRCGKGIPTLKLSSTSVYDMPCHIETTLETMMLDTSHLSRVQPIGGLLISATVGSHLNFVQAALNIIISWSKYAAEL